MVSISNSCSITNFLCKQRSVVEDKENEQLVSKCYKHFLFDQRTLELDCRLFYISEKSFFKLFYVVFYVGTLRTKDVMDLFDKYFPVSKNIQNTLRAFQRPNIFL